MNIWFKNSFIDAKLIKLSLIFIPIFIYFIGTLNLFSPVQNFFTLGFLF